MLEPQFVEEPRECPRCNQLHCPRCIDFHEVDFNILDCSEKNQFQEKEWIGEEVCPWCYNQLSITKKVSEATNAK